MADERDLKLRLLLEIPDARVPPLDTKEADRTLNEFVQRAKQANREVAQSAGSAAASAVSPAAFPVTSVRRVSSDPISSAERNWRHWVQNAPRFGPGGHRGPDPSVDPYFQLIDGSIVPRDPSADFYPIGSRQRIGQSRFTRLDRGPAGTYFPYNPGSPAQGPISDPGSFAQSSLQTGRGYDVALLRQQMEEFNPQQLQNYSSALNEIGISARRITYSISGLAGSVALLNLAMREGSGFDNAYTLGIAGIGAVGYGSQILSGSVGITRAGARIGGGLLSQAGTAAGGGIAGQGLLRLGGRALGGIAGASAFSLGAPIAVGAAGLGALGYYSYQNQKELEEGASLDERANFQNRRREEFNSNLGNLRLRQAARRGDLGFYDTVITADRLAGGSADDEQTAVSLLRTKSKLLEEIARTRQQDVRLQQQANQETQQALQLERSRAGAVAGDVGRLGRGSLNRLGNLISRAGRNGLDFRTATQIEAIIGRREGGAATEFIDERGQGLIDTDPALREFLGNDARTSRQIEQLDQQMRALEIENQRLGINLTNLLSSIQAMVDELNEKALEALERAEQAKLRASTFGA